MTNQPPHANAAPTPPQRPTVVSFFYAYITFMNLLYAIVFAFSLLAIALPPDADQPPSDVPADTAASQPDPTLFDNDSFLQGADPQFVGQLLAVFSIVMIILFTTSYFINPNRFRWVYALILLAIGALNLCLWPVVLPILYFWLQPNNRLYHQFNPLDVYHRQHFGPDIEPPKH
ncbi:hypothetical protein KS4_08570 [Poriferisphaera corsica]|uniref:Uncharacterized protein n=1 Tax=Poriferisphaera corsica TaxID=2528020 RepID=A0A517YRJ8_9BACT|nr:hypothetical protein [Poriferisphaera corsica]QDU32821.1 hypothetical protein KS4_08570 [Poriferisphaera corsica]